MKKSEFDKLIELEYTGGFMFKPTNPNAMELCNMLKLNEKTLFKPMGERDAKLHGCYFVLLNFIWGYLPDNFHKRVPNKTFYIWLKHLKKEYDIVFSFVDEDKVSDMLDFCEELDIDVEKAMKIASRFGKTDLIEYESISFGRMSNQRFKEYVKSQLPYIYENVIGKFFTGDQYDSIIDTIEGEFEKFLSKL